MTPLYFEALDHQALAQGGFGQWKIMVPKIPIAAPGELYVRAHGDKPAAGFQTTEHLLERPAQRRFIREMLEEVACENEIKFAIGQRPFCRAILLEEFDAGI